MALHLGPKIIFFKFRYNHHIYIVDPIFLSPKPYPIEKVKAKMVALKYAGDYNDDDDEEEYERNEKIVCIPLLHTLR